MLLQNWLALGIGWLLSGPIFVVVSRAVGLQFEARSSLPIGARIPRPGSVGAPTVRSGATRHSAHPDSGRRSPLMLPTDESFWTRGERPIARSGEQAAGD